MLFNFFQFLPVDAAVATSCNPVDAGRVLLDLIPSERFRQARSWPGPLSENDVNQETDAAVCQSLQR